MRVRAAFREADESSGTITSLLGSAELPGEPGFDPGGALDGAGDGDPDFAPAGEGPAGAA